MKNWTFTREEKNKMKRRNKICAILVWILIPFAFFSMIAFIIMPKTFLQINDTILIVWLMLPALISLILLKVIKNTLFYFKSYRINIATKRYLETQRITNMYQNLILEFKDYLHYGNFL